VTGLIDPARVFTNANARPGDVLILIKPIGTDVHHYSAQAGQGRSGMG
jgi:selenide, water dikinase